MSPADLLPAHCGLAVTDATITPDIIVLAVTCDDPTAICPACGVPSDWVHSRYGRTLADLPVNGRRFVLRLRARRFFCGNPDCDRAVFCERLPGLAEARARSTTRLTDLHRAIGFALGGEPGSRLAEQLVAPTSGDTILRRVKATPDEPEPLYRYVGVDDFAFRKGHSYGTILIDLERGRVIDILDGRDGAAVQAWLQAHPGVEVITRDRWSGYTNAATVGAPQATQVADRWHLLRNLRDALIGILDRHHSEVHAAAQPAEAQQQSRSTVPPEVSAEAQPVPTPAEPDSATPDQPRRARRLSCYEQVRELHRQGVSRRQIARRLGLDRETVKRFVDAESFPERSQRRSRRTTDPFAAYLKQRFDEGCRNAAGLFEELKSRGFRGSYYAVRRQLARWREPTRPGGSGRVAGRVERPSSRDVSWLLLKTDADLDAGQRTFRERLLARSPRLRAATDLAREFWNMVRERRPADWEGWLVRATTASAPQELRALAEGLKKDEAAVRAALELKWSNGQVEGQVNRLKFIKRSGYGRAGFRLLRARVRNKT